MRGSYSDPQARQEARQLWAKENVPSYAVGEVYPLRPLLSRWSDLVAVDVGANKGFWTKALMRTFGDGVRHVYLLDPSPENQAELNNRDDNLIFAPEDFARFSAHAVAAGSTSGEAVLYTNEDGSPLASLYPHAGDTETRRDQRIPVQVVTLDAFLDAQGVAHVDIVKLDVEGHELEVLKGAARALRSGRIDIVMWEFGRHHIESGCSFRDFHDLLSAAGFEVYSLASVGARLIPEYDPEYERFESEVMFAARRRGAPLIATPEGFTEEGYLEANPDVRGAVAGGVFASGRQHWLTFGHQEKRPLHPG